MMEKSPWGNTWKFHGKLGEKKNEKRTTGFLSYAQFALDILGLPGFPVSDTPGTITDLWSIIL